MSALGGGVGAGALGGGVMSGARGNVTSFGAGDGGVPADGADCPGGFGPGPGPFGLGLGLGPLPPLFGVVIGLDSVIEEIGREAGEKQGGGA